jgi:hypothetical protein
MPLGWGRVSLPEQIDLRYAPIFLFSGLFIGLFWVIDAVAFNGQNSADAWQEANQLGQKLSRGVQDQARQYLR